MPLVKALDEIASQTGTRITYDPDAVPGLTSSPVRGGRSAKAAVDIAIRGTGLSAAVERDGHISVGNDILVTATRDEAETSFRVDGAQSSNRSGKSLKELPQGTEVVTSALIRQQQALTINDALRNAAGVVNSTGNTQGTPSFAIRGNVASALQNGIASNANSNAVDTVERIEVLKGPSAILAGANNLGGVVNIVDKRPSAEPILDVTAQFGSFGEKKVVVDASDALNTDKTISARIVGVQAGSERSYGGYFGRREKVIAPSLRYKTSASDIVVGINASETRKPLENFRIIDPRDTDSFLDLPARIGPRAQGFDNVVTRYYGSAEQRVLPWLTLVARGTYTRDSLKAALYLPVGFIDPENPNILGTFAQSINQQQRNGSADGYARLNFNTGPLRHTVTAGYNWSRLNLRAFRRDLAVDNFFPLNVRQDNSGLPSPTPADIFDYEFTTVQNGFYAQDFVDWGPLHVLVAVRRNKYKITGELSDVGFGASSSDDRAAATTPSFGAVLDLTKKVSVYANYQRGFSPNTGLTCDGARVPNVSSENIEAGAKADLFGKRLSATASVFQLKQDNTTLSDFGCELPSRFISLDGIRTRGVELTLNGEILPSWAVNASYTYADNVYQEPSLDFGTVPSGLYKHKYSVYSLYQFQQGPLKGLGVAGGVFGNGRTYVDPFGAIFLRPQVQFDANVTYETGGFRFNIGVKNIANRRLNAIATSPNYVAYLQPRTFLASLTYRFFR